MNYSPMTEKLATAWAVKYEEAQDILTALDAKKWAGGEGLDSIKYAGVINDESTQDKMYGNTGYWIADDDEHICAVTNGDAAWVDWTEETADSLGLFWQDYNTEMEEYAI